MRFLLLLICSIVGEALVAQSFTALPATTLDHEVAFNEANECYIFFDHPGINTLHLKWRQLEISMPDGWSADLCDYGLCYIGIPANGTMNPASDTIQPYLKVIVQPNNVPGSAWMWFRAIEVGNDANFSDVYFNLFTPGTVGVQAPQSLNVRLFPNPASQTLFIESHATQPLPVRLTDVTGRGIWQGILRQEATEIVDLLPYPDGLYFLQLPDRTEKILIQK